MFSFSTTRFSRCGLPLLVAFAVAAPAMAETSELYRKLWSDPAVVKKIDDGIEANRKGRAVIEIVDENGKPVPGARIQAKQQTHEFLFGCNAFVLGQMKEKNNAYEDAFLKLFNFATVPFYWNGTEPKQGELRYQEGCCYKWRRPPPDRVVAFGKKHGLTLKAHPLLYHGCRAPWEPEDAELLKKLHEKRFSEIAARYANDIEIWVITNESSTWKQTKFPLYTPDRANVAWAFQQAHRYFRPENVLMINDGPWCQTPAVADKNAYYQQIKKLNEQGASVEGVGLHFHLWSNTMKALLRKHKPPYQPLELFQSYGLFAKLGLPMYISEVTISSAVDDGKAVQAEVTGNLYRLWFSLPRMAGITWWNLADGTACENENVHNGGLLDKNMNPKPAYNVLDQLINHEWKTQADGKTDAKGQYTFRGFHGKYQVTVDTPAGPQQFEVNLSKSGDANHKLTLEN